MQPIEVVSCSWQRPSARCELFVDFVITQYFTIQLLLPKHCHTHEVSKPIQELKLLMVHTTECKWLPHNFTAVWNRYCCEMAKSLIRWSWRTGFNHWCNFTSMYHIIRWYVTITRVPHPPKKKEIKKHTHMTKHWQHATPCVEKLRLRVSWI